MFKSTRMAMPDGSVHYYNQFGRLHREDGPAIEYCKSKQGGVNKWYYDGRPHRSDGPAYTHADGTTEWWFNGKRHRDNGPAIETSFGTKKFYYQGTKIDCETTEEFLRIIKLKEFW